MSNRLGVRTQLLSKLTMKTRGLLAVLATSSMAALILGSGPAAALKQEGFTIREGAPVTKSYGAIAGSYPFNDARNAMTCETLAHCDVMPIIIEAPADIGADEDFIVRIVLSWDYRKVNGTTTNDMGMRMYTSRSTGDTFLGDSDGSEPELILLFKPVARTYKILVANNSGANTGYTLSARLTREPSSPPLEVGETETPRSRDEEFGPVTDFSDVPEDSGSPASGAPTEFSAAPLALAPVEPDETFESLGRSGGTLPSLLSSPIDLLSIGPEETSPPNTVSGMQVVLWGGLLPVALLLVLVLWARRHDPARLEGLAAAGLGPA